MINELSKNELELDEFMSELSEEAFTAGWMTGLEYALWEAVISGPKSYGRLDITNEHIKKLILLSENCGGWIYFDDETEETFMTKECWVEHYKNYKSK